ncbi:hypothetical protein HY483_04360 [Candidatus Woesearchaeota archaeon]|nr:hypothetical protein [Candidatus Woesearchaeota archaeon]
MRLSIILVLTTVALFLASCSSGGNQQSLGSTFIGGVEGITIGFEQGQPPAEVYDSGQQSFSITLKVQNKGEFDVPKNKTTITLSGFNPTTFNRTRTQLSQSSPDDLLALRKLPTGDIQEQPPTQVEFPNMNHNGKVIGLEQKVPVEARICYEYKNTATTNLCVRKNLITPATGGVCEVVGSKEASNSGGPIQITAIKTSARSQNSLGIAFTISHQGTGAVYKLLSQCSQSQQQRVEEGRILVKIDSGLTGLSCTGLSDTSTSGTTFQGVAKFMGTPLTITCTQQISDLNDYSQPVTITTEYNYEEIATTTLTVKSSTG